MIQFLLADLLPIRTIAVIVLVGVGLQLVGIDVIGMGLDFVASLIPDLSWSDLTGGLV